MEPDETDSSPGVAGRKGLRTEWATGTCASAAAKAADLATVSGRRTEQVEVALPSWRRVGFPVEWDSAGRARVMRDAGHDPDCTDGARMTAEMRAGEDHVLRAGEGIGTITKPSLSFRWVPRRSTRCRDA